jgi:8-hydroxy-5-deazaflavin:NADPH oxidoreductase
VDSKSRETSEKKKGSKHMATYRIAVLGAGNIGGTLGRKWVNAGHTVTFGVKDPSGERAKALQTELGTRATIGSLAQALQGADVVLFAIPGRIMEETIIAHAAQLDNKILIDAANKVSADPMNSVATLQAHTPHAHVYRAFNIYGWENFADPLYNGVQADLFYSGPDGETRAVIEQLIGEIGLRPVRVGDTDQAAVVDGVLPLWFTLSRSRGSRHFALKLLTR